MDEPILQHFTYAHLPAHLAVVSEPFAVLAKRIVEHIPRNPERTVALRKLLEAKDAAVRAVVQHQNENAPSPSVDEQLKANEVSASDIYYGQRPPT